MRRDRVISGLLFERLGLDLLFRGFKAFFIFFFDKVGRSREPVPSRGVGIDIAMLGCGVWGRGWLKRLMLEALSATSPSDERVPVADRRGR